MGILYAYCICLSASSLNTLQYYNNKHLTILSTCVSGKETLTHPHVGVGIILILNESRFGWTIANQPNNLTGKITYFCL